MFAAKHEPKATMGVDVVMKGASGAQPASTYSPSAPSRLSDSSVG